MKKNIVILGPTGSGKTAVAIELAKNIGGEIISCDSMQAYQNMAIGTAQPTSVELQEIPYHLINFLDIFSSYSAKEFCNLCQQKITQINKKKLVSIITGGTGLYAHFLIYGHDNFPSDEKVATEILQDYQAGKYAKLCNELVEKNPQLFEKIKNNYRRVLRAVEISRLLPNCAQMKSQNSSQEFHQFILWHSPEILKKRLENRAKIMLENGWIEEARKLFLQNFFTTPTAKQAIGYQEIYDFLNPKILFNNQKHLAIHTEKDLFERITIKTNQYAKKQRTWFKTKHTNAIFINCDNLSSTEICEKICEKICEN